MDLTENRRAVDAFTYGAGTSLDGASLTSGEVEELRRTCLAQGGTQESPGGTSPAGAR